MRHFKEFSNNVNQYILFKSWLHTLYNFVPIVFLMNFSAFFMTLVVSRFELQGLKGKTSLEEERETIKKVTCRFLAAVKRVVPWICFSTKGCGSHANCEFFPKYSSLLSKKSAQPSKIFAKLSRKRSMEPELSQEIPKIAVTCVI